MRYATNDTIVAVSSAPGAGLRGVLRFSGPDALTIASALFVSDGAVAPVGSTGFSRLTGNVRLDGQGTLPAECYVFHAPHSYTRQDCAELHTLGSAPLLAMLTEQALRLGARQAEPGEFTARAFLAGAMDLTEAEAVAAVIHARSDAELSASARLRQGELARMTAAFTDELADLAALVEADIDFSTEPIDFIRPAQLRDRLDALCRRLDTLLELSLSAERLANLPTVLLMGAPNAGKSSLLNALTGIDRAICSAVAGTTRDVLSAPMALGEGSGEVILLDAAGLDDSPGAIAQQGRHRARDAAERADLLCLVVDLTTEPDANTVEPLRAVVDRKVLVAANKTDLLDREEARRRIVRLSDAGLGRVCATSAVTGEGLNHLRRSIRDALDAVGRAGDDRTIALTARQRGALDQCQAAMGRARALADETVDTADCAELFAADLREALHALGQVSGAVTTDDLLGRIFGSFCIGK